MFVLVVKYIIRIRKRPHTRVTHILKVVCNIFAFIQCLNKALLEIWESIFIVHRFFFLFTRAIRYLLCLFVYREEEKNPFILKREGDTNDKKKLFSSPSLSLCVLIARPHFCIYTWLSVYTYCSLLFLE